MGEAVSNRTPTSPSSRVPDRRGQEVRGFTRTARSKAAGQRYSLARAFSNAGAGLLFALRTERNVKIDVLFAVLAVLLGFALQVDVASWLAIVVCVGMMFALETLNTAIEAVVDLASPDYHELAKRAKDCAAGAALAGALASAVVGCIVFVPRLWALVF